MIKTIICVIALKGGMIERHDLGIDHILDAQQACQVISDQLDGVEREWLEFIKEN